MRKDNTVKISHFDSELKARLGYKNEPLPQYNKQRLVPTWAEHIPKGNDRD